MGEDNLTENKMFIFDNKTGEKPRKINRIKKQIEKLDGWRNK